MYINKAIVYGNLTRDPELNSLPNGEKVANFCLATNRIYTDKEKTKKEEVEYHNIVVFGNKANTICQYMKKGSPMYVEGRIMTRSWEKDGMKQYKTEIVLEGFQFGPKTYMVGQEITPEEIPF